MPGWGGVCTCSVEGQIGFDYLCKPASIAMVPATATNFGREGDFMSKTKDQAIQEINSHIKNNGAILSNWYVGIAADPRDRLFNDHGVQEKGGTWIFCPTTSSTVARAVEKAFLDAGAQGGGGGGDDKSVYVYAYKIR